MTTIYGGTVIAVEGTYDDVNRLCAELTSERPSWPSCNVNVRRTTPKGRRPSPSRWPSSWDGVPRPRGGAIALGSQLTKVAKGFAELGRSGFSTSAHVRVSGLRPRVALGGHGVRSGERRHPNPSSPRPSRSRSPSQPGRLAGYALQTMRETAAPAPR